MSLSQVLEGEHYLPDGGPNWKHQIVTGHRAYLRSCSALGCWPGTDPPVKGIPLFLITGPAESIRLWRLQDKFDDV